MSYRFLIISILFFSPLQDSTQWPIVDPLPSYGRGIELPGGSHRSLINGYNLTDVVITGMHSYSHICFTLSFLSSFSFALDSGLNSVSPASQYVVCCLL